MAEMTKAQRLYLNAICDWATPYEVQATLGLMTVKTATVAMVLKFLVRDGLAQYGDYPNTYRITETGRRALMITDEMTNFLHGVVGVVEANSFESLCLWEEAEEQGRSWISNNSGFGQTVGQIAGMPVCLSLLTAEVEGHKILFIDPTSQVVDHRMIEEWLAKTLPKSAFRDDGFVNKTNAMNFHNVFPRRALTATSPAAEIAGTTRELRFVFDAFPSPEGPRFIEVEDENGCSLNAGEWRKREDGLVELVVRPSALSANGGK